MSGTGFKSRKQYNPDQQYDNRLSNVSQDADTTMLVNQRTNIVQSHSPVNVGKHGS